MALVVERGFALALGGAALGAMAWSQLQLQRSPAPLGDESLERLFAAAGEGAVPARMISGALLGLLLGGVYLLVRRGRAAAAALGTALRRRPPGAGPSWLALFLLGFGGMVLCEVLASAPLPRIVVVASRAGADEDQVETRRLSLARPLPVGGPAPAQESAPHLPLAGDEEAPRALVRWLDMGPWLEVRPGASPLRVGAGTPEPGQVVPLELGAPVEVGPWTLRVEGPSPAQAMWHRTAGQVLAAVLLLLGWRSVSRAGVTAPTPLLRELLRGGRAWVGCLPLYVATLALTTALLHLLGLRAAGHPLVRAVEREGLVLLLPVAIQAALLAPIVEETVFRGLLLPGLQRPLGRPAGLFLSAVVFAAIHGGLAAALPMLVLGLLFGGLRETGPEGSLAAPIVAHALHNGVTLLLVGAILLLG